MSVSVNSTFPRSESAGVAQTDALPDSFPKLTSILRSKCLGECDFAKLAEIEISLTISLTSCEVEAEDKIAATFPNSSWI